MQSLPESESGSPPKGPPKGTKRPRTDSIISNASDGAVWIGGNPSRPATPEQRVRRPVPPTDDQQPLPTFEEETTSRPRHGRFNGETMYFWRKEKEQADLLQALLYVWMIVLIFSTLRNLASDCPPQAASVVSRGGTAEPAWTPAHQPSPIISPVSNTANLRQGVSASEVWTFFPKALKGAMHLQKALPKALDVSGLPNKPMSDVLVPNPDHGWDRVIANKDRRGHFLSVLAELDGLSPTLQVELDSQFPKKSRENYLERAVIMGHLQELQTQQSEITRKSWDYQRVSSLAASALDRYRQSDINTKQSEIRANDLTWLRSSLKDSGYELLDHLDTAEKNIDLIKEKADNMPWKAKMGSWLGRYMYRSLDAAVSRLEHLKTYVNLVRGMVTSDVYALR